jgi:hypothetical protein
VGSRSLLFAVTLAFSAQSTGVLEALGGSCAEPCDDDDDQGRCPPTCASCSCAPRVSEPVRVLLSLTAPETTMLEPTRPADAYLAGPQDGFADEILHVPIRA